jgi:hypothetical protein
MSTVPAAPPPLELPDRSVRLMVLGGLQIMLGCLCGLMVVLMGFAFFLGSLSKGPRGQPVDARAMIPGLFVYVLLTVGFIWVGIGLIRPRRWAWTLTVVMSWMALIFGLFAFASVQLFMGPKTWEAIAEQGKSPAAAITALRTMINVILLVIYVLLPGLFVILATPRSVRQTCYRLDPKIRWTDRCPMPVLALTIMLAFAAVSMPTLIAYKCVMPLFGVVLSGTAGAAAIGLIALALAYLAWGTYRLQMLAWWGTLLYGLAATLSSAVTFWRGDLMQMYEKMGLPAEQIERIRKMGIVETMSQLGPGMTLAFGVAWFGYLVYVRRYFVRKGDVTSGAG